MKTLFLTLRTFSATGGIEKVCRIMGKALYEESVENDGLLQVCSMYDKQQDAIDNLYFPFENFRGFGVNKLKFFTQMVQDGPGYHRVVLSHINLLPIGWLIKNEAPRTKIILLAHGIEIWYPLMAYKRKMLHRCDRILAVSTYTKNRVMAAHGVPAEKVAVLNNCLDPYLPLPSVYNNSKELFKKYGFTPSDIVIMTLTRMASKERYKGYEKVMEAIAALTPRFPGIKYLVAGRYDTREKAFIDGLIQKLAIRYNVVMPGFIPDKELEAHFAISDMYVMPSRKEGFGIVFIEAMYYGLPVIAGNIDGSADALLNGKLGQLVNPDDVEEIKQAIANIIERKTDFIPSRSLLTKHFSYETYKNKLYQSITFEPVDALSP